MPLNGSGTYNLPNPPVFPAVAGTTIKASDFNTIMTDMASAITAMIARDGQSTITGVLQWAQPAANLAALGGVALTGAQTIAGVKTFSSAPVSSAAASAANELMRKGEVDSAVAAAAASKADLAGSASQVFSVAPATDNNHAVRRDQSFAIGQTWQDMTASRALGTTYTNTTGKPIIVAVTTHNTGGNDCDLRVDVDGLRVYEEFIASPYVNSKLTCSVIVPAGSTYRAQSVDVLSKWHELR